MARAHGIRCVLCQWRRWYDKASSESVDAPDKRFETLGVCLANAVIIDRLIVAIDPVAGLELEQEAQSLARQIFQIADAAAKVNPRAALFMEFKLMAARAALATEDDWQTFIRNAQAERFDKPVPKELFERWCSVKGRRIT